jgi:hypothetical protein
MFPSSLAAAGPIIGILITVLGVIALALALVFLRHIRGPK